MDKHIILQGLTIDDLKNIIAEVIASRPAPEQSPPAKDEFLTCAEAAKLLKISQQTLRTYIKNGKIPSIKNGRKFIIKRSALYEY